MECTVWYCTRVSLVAGLEYGLEWWNGLWNVLWNFCVEQMATFCFIPYSRGSFIMYRMSLLELIEYAKYLSP